MARGGFVQVRTSRSVCLFSHPLQRSVAVLPLCAAVVVGVFDFSAAPANPRAALTSMRRGCLTHVPRHDGVVCHSNGVVMCRRSTGMCMVRGNPSALLHKMRARERALGTKCVSHEYGNGLVAFCWPADAAGHLRVFLSPGINSGRGGCWLPLPLPSTSPSPLSSAAIVL